MAIAASAKAHTEVRIQRLDHTTIPVRDQFAAARFYAVVFNGEIDHVGRPFLRVAPDSVKHGMESSAHHGMGVKVCDGVVFALFEQDYGQPTAEQGHPHHALEIRPEDISQWIEHLNYWDVPFDGPIPRVQDKSVSIYFFDLDGNHLELHSTNLPDALFSQFPQAAHNHEAQVRERPWPPQGREEEANRLLAEKIAEWIQAGAH